MTVQPSGASGAATPSICTPAVVGVFERRGAGVALAVHEPDERLVLRGCRRARRAAFSFGLPWAISWPFGCDDQRVALLADSDAIDHPPHFFEADLADERAGTLSDLGQSDAHDRRGQQITVDIDWRNGDVRSERCAGLRELKLRLADATGGELSAGGVVERDLSEFGKVEDRILEDAILLPTVEIGVLRGAGDRLKNVDVGLDVQTDLLGDAPGDVLVAGDDGSSGGFAKREDRNSAVDQKRQNTGRGEEQCESRGDPFQFAASLASFQSLMVMRMSPPGALTTLKRRLTARAVSPHARNIAGGSSKHRLLKPTKCLLVCVLVSGASRCPQGRHQPNYWR